VPEQKVVQYGVVKNDNARHFEGFSVDFRVQGVVAEVVERDIWGAEAPQGMAQSLGVVGYPGA
jgi:hypothetical protein